MAYLTIFRTDTDYLTVNGRPRPKVAYDYVPPDGTNFSKRGWLTAQGNPAGEDPPTSGLPARYEVEVIEPEEPSAYLESIEQDLIYGPTVTLIDHYQLEEGFMTAKEEQAAVAATLDAGTKKTGKAVSRPE